MTANGGEQGNHRFAVSRSDVAIAFEFSSAEALADQVIDMSAGFLRERGTRQTNTLAVVLRELLRNAISHGNGGDESRLVRFTLGHMGEGDVVATVEDEGPGFDHESLIDEIRSGAVRAGRRGYILITALSDEVLFNGKGNRITVRMDLAASGACSPGKGREANIGARPNTREAKRGQTVHKA
jgi:anti-sigma regulatory factor (Ser/Thr protein kinase)